MIFRNFAIPFEFFFERAASKSRTSEEQLITIEKEKYLQVFFCALRTGKQEKNTFQELFLLHESFFLLLVQMGEAEILLMVTKKK